MREENVALEAKIAQLSNLDLRRLRALWAECIGAVPKHQSAELLRRRLAYELQVMSLGGLKPIVRRRLERLHQAFSANPNFVPLPTNNFAAGTVLTKVWRGKTYKVDVLAEGFEYENKYYNSLSQIAQLMTGSKRSGPAFFGFREAPR